MALKILATGDLHIGKKSSSVPGDLEEVATKYTWNRIVKWAIENQADVLLLSGDIVDQDNRYFEAIGPLQSGFLELKQAGITVFMVAGNHDFEVLPQIVTSGKFDNVHLLGPKGTWETKSITKNGQTIQFVGWSFPTRHFITDPFLTFDPTIIDANFPCIGLVHGDVFGTDDKYAPIEKSSFLNKPVQTWILGHIHKPEEIRNANPYICYPGSPHALSSREPGIHGPLLFRVEDNDEISVERIQLSPVRYAHEIIDISGTTDESSVRNLITTRLFDCANNIITDLEEVSFLVYDISLEGEHHQIREVENWVSPIIKDYEHRMETGTVVSVRKLLLDLRPKVEDMEELAKTSSPVGVLAKTILSLQTNESTEFLDQILQNWKLNQQVLTRANTYQPLNKTGKADEDMDSLARASVLKECNCLLGERIEQTS